MWPNVAANGGIALLFKSPPFVAAVAELGSGLDIRPVIIPSSTASMAAAPFDTADLRPLPRQAPENFRTIP